MRLVRCAICRRAMLLVLALVAPTDALTQDRTPQEIRGEQVYTKGTSATGREITALFGAAATEIPARAAPCANCHGMDGRGRPEGGVSPSDLTWPAMTNPYGVRHPSGREHPAYDEQLLRRAITSGVDPAGNVLHVAMPRYRLSSRDLDDLVAYVKRLGELQDPGVTADTITLGSLLPLQGSFAAQGEAMRAILLAYFDELNLRGGLYGRRLELRIAPLSQAPDAALRRMLERHEVFALISTFLPGAEEHAASLVAEFEIPLVGPFTLRPQHALPINRFVFYLLPGVDTQARVLVQSAAEFVGHPPRAAVVFLEGGGYDASVRGMLEEAAEAAWPEVEIFSYPRGSMKPAALAAELKQSAIEALFLLVPGEDQAALLRAAEALAWHTRVFLPGALAGREISAAPKSFSGKIFIAVPMLPSDQSQAGAKQYRELAAKYQLPETYRPIQLATLGAARVLVEGLKRAGRDLSRDRLLEALEGLYEFETGLTPPVTYGPNRRLAVQGAHVMSADLQRGQFLRTGGWRALR